MNTAATTAAKTSGMQDASSSAGPLSGPNKAPSETVGTTPNNWQTAWRNAWHQRSARERSLLSLGALVLVLATLWSVALAPALRTWQEAPTKQAQLDAQSQRMRQLQTQAQGMQKPQTLSRAEAIEWLEKSLNSLGPNAQISVQGESATLRLQAAPAQALAHWMVQARENAQALPLQADVQQTDPPQIDALWRGTVVLRLPANP
jgi:general secretion pathway protein M